MNSHPDSQRMSRTAVGAVPVAPSMSHNLHDFIKLIEELKEDDRKFPGQDESPLRSAGYPPLDEVAERSDALLELLDVFLHEELFTAFVPDSPSAAGRFMINSIETVSAGLDTVVVRGRGYHAAANPAPPPSHWKQSILLRGSHDASILSRRITPTERLNDAAHHCRHHFLPIVGPRLCHIVHDGRLHSCLAGDRHYRGRGSADSKPTSTQ